MTSPHSGQEPSPDLHHDSFSTAYYRTLGEHVERLVERGWSADDAVGRVAQVGIEALAKTTPGFVQTLKDSAPAMLEDRSRLHREFVGRLRAHWGSALDLFYVIAVCAEELGSGFYSRWKGLLTGDERDLHEALSGVQARACRTAFETHHLLSGGFPFGALARARTLHELAVIANVLGEFGDKQGHRDLGARYLAFDAMQNRKDADNYQKAAGRLGYEPFSDDEMRALSQEHAQAVRRFPDLDAKNGWANGLGGHRHPTFEQLEELVGLAHLRPFYDLASHEVHANAKGTRLNVLTRGARAYKSTGSSDAGLAEPGQMALISLNQATAAMLDSRRDVPPSDLLGLQGINQLLDEACHAFADAEIAKRDSASAK